jgi:hypothetical protein
MFHLCSLHALHGDDELMDGFIPGIPAGKPNRVPLINAAGDFDHKALVAWLNDFSCWKAYSTTDLGRLSIKEGDLLITDADASLAASQFVVVTDIDVDQSSVAMVQNDDEGHLWAVFSDTRLPLDSDMELLITRLVGFVPMKGEERPATPDDLLLAHLLPELPATANWEGPSHWAVGPRRQDQILQRLGMINQGDLPF